MASSTVSVPDTTANPNSLALIEARMADGRISWIGPLLLVSARSVLLIVSQGFVALILLARHHPSPWREAGYWWNVYGTLVDIGCLVGLPLFHPARRNSDSRSRRSHLACATVATFLSDLAISPSYFPALLSAGILHSGFSTALPVRTRERYVFEAHAFPVWATIYALSLWWMIWSPTGELDLSRLCICRGSRHSQAGPGSHSSSSAFGGRCSTAHYRSFPTPASCSFVSSHFCPAYWPR